MSIYIEFHIPCEECGGLGTNFRPSECPHCPTCKGLGYIVKGDFYDSIKNAKEEYPHAIKMNVIR